MKFLQVQYIDKVVVVTVADTTPSTSIQPVQKTVEVLQTQYLDRVAYAPAVSQRHVPAIHTIHKMVEAAQNQYLDPSGRRARGIAETNLDDAEGDENGRDPRDAVY